MRAYLSLMFNCNFTNGNIDEERRARCFPEQRTSELRAWMDWKGLPLFTPTDNRFTPTDNRMDGRGWARNPFFTNITFRKIKIKHRTRVSPHLNVKFYYHVMLV